MKSTILSFVGALFKIYILGVVSSLEIYMNVGEGLQFIFFNFINDG